MQPERVVSLRFMPFWLLPPILHLTAADNNFACALRTWYRIDGTFCPSVWLCYVGLIAEQIDASPGMTLTSLIHDNPIIERMEIWDVIQYLSQQGLMHVEECAGIDSYYMSCTWLTEKVKINQYLSINLPKQSVRHFMVK